MRSLTDPWTLGGHRIPNRVVLAPLAGIGNWFVRLQAQRHGAGLAVSEMVSSFAIHYRNEKTCTELLRIHPDERLVSIQLFGQDPDVMRSAAATVAAAGADAVMLARGSLGNPWVFEQLLGRRAEDESPTPDEILAELDWLIDRAVEHFGSARAARWLRKAYPWYVERLVGGKALQAALQA